MADTPGLVGCAAALVAEDGAARDPHIDADWPRTADPGRFEAAIADPDRLVLVAELNGVVVGSLTGHLQDGWAMRPVRSAELVSMYVRPEHRRGQVGARLTEQFLAWAKQGGAAVAAVTAYDTNAGALRFYERNGFARHAVTLERPI